jgi:3-hydroxyisobutyrate dehydrogenase
MSTISPQATAEFADRIRKKECEMLDAPVSGGEKGAVEGTLSIMVGGKEEPFELCLPLFEAMGKTVTHTGPNGNGQRTKLVNQVVGAITILATTEGIRLAAAAGLNVANTLSALSGGAAASWALTHLGSKIEQKDFAPGFSLQLQHKDLRLVKELAAQLNLDLPAAELTHCLFSHAVEKGLGHHGHHALIKLWSLEGDR